jgi:hypothetical protein
MLEASTPVTDFQGSTMTQLNDDDEFSLTANNAIYSNSAGKTEITNAASYLAQISGE